MCVVEQFGVTEVSENATLQALSEKPVVPTFEDHLSFSQRTPKRLRMAGHPQLRNLEFFTKVTERFITYRD
jgi:hypothetical protein